MLKQDINALEKEVEKEDQNGSAQSPGNYAEPS